jgi:hypothetical protein
MLLTDLIGAVAYAEGRKVGNVVDVRLVPGGPEFDQPMPKLKIHGLLISPHTNSSTLGYERSDVNSPGPIDALDRWRHRDSFLALWDDVEQIDQGKKVTLRPGHARYSPVLVKSACVRPEFE